VSTWPANFMHALAERGLDSDSARRLTSEALEQATDHGLTPERMFGPATAYADQLARAMRSVTATPLPAPSRVAGARSAPLRWCDVDLVAGRVAPEVCVREFDKVDRAARRASGITGRAASMEVAPITKSGESAAIDIGAVTVELPSARRFVCSHPGLNMTPIRVSAEWVFRQVGGP